MRKSPGVGGRRGVLAKVVLAAVALTAGCGGGPPSPDTVATSDHGVFTLRDLDRFIASLPESERRPAPGQEPVSWRLDMAREMVAAPALIEEGRALVAHDPERASRLEQPKRRFLVQQLVRRIEQQRAPVSADDVRTYYDAHRDEFERGESLSLRHIFRRVPRRASESERRTAMAEVEAIVTELGTGTSFDDLARLRSHSESAAGGGLLGPVERGDLDPAIEDVVWSLAEGETSPVVSTPSGFHVFKVEGRLPPWQTDFEEARGRILRDLESKATRNLVAEQFQVLLAASEASYHSERLLESWQQPDTNLLLFPHPDDEDLGLSVGDVRAGWESFSFAQQRRQLPPDHLFSVALDRLLLWKARSLDMAEEPEIVVTLSALEEGLLQEMAYTERVERWLEAVPESTLRELYSAEPERWLTPRLHHLRILSRNIQARHPDVVRDELGAVAAEVRSGKGDFAELASRYSEDISRSVGGDVGWNRLDDIAAWIGSGVLEDLSALRPGEVSEPLAVLHNAQAGQTRRRAAFVIVQVVDIREPEQRPFERVRRTVAIRFLDMAPDRARREIRDDVLATTHAVFYEENL